MLQALKTSLVPFIKWLSSAVLRGITGARETDAGYKAVQALGASFVDLGQANPGRVPAA